MRYMEDIDLNELRKAFPKAKVWRKNDRIHVKFPVGFETISRNADDDTTEIKPYGYFPETTWEYCPKGYFFGKDTDYPLSDDDSLIRIIKSMYHDFIDTDIPMILDDDDLTIGLRKHLEKYTDYRPIE